MATTRATDRTRRADRLRRWWHGQCWVVRSGVDSTWRASNVDVHCAPWVPRRLAIRRARAAIINSYPTYGHLARLVGVKRWELCGPTRVYRGWRVIFDKTDLYRAIYGHKPFGGQ